MTDAGFELARLLKPLACLKSERSSRAEESVNELLFEKVADCATALCCASWEHSACDSGKGAQAGTADAPESSVRVQSASNKSYSKTTQN